jgi:hypothetical protein
MERCLSPAGQMSTAIIPDEHVYFSILPTFCMIPTEISRKCPGEQKGDGNLFHAPIKRHKGLAEPTHPSHIPNVHVFHTNYALKNNN